MDNRFNGRCDRPAEQTTSPLPAGPSPGRLGFPPPDPLGDPNGITQSVEQKGTDPDEAFDPGILSVPCFGYAEGGEDSPCTRRS